MNVCTSDSIAVALEFPLDRENRLLCLFLLSCQCCISSRHSCCRMCSCWYLLVARVYGSLEVPYPSRESCCRCPSAHDQVEVDNVFDVRDRDLQCDLSGPRPYLSGYRLASALT